MLVMHYGQIDRQANLVSYSYWVDPGKFEIDTTLSSPQDSPWHPEKLPSNPLRAAFAKQFVAYAEAMADSLQLVFQLKPPATIPAPAFAFKE